MSTEAPPLQQVEGQWEDLVASPQFAGHRVRITVLNDQQSAAEFQERVRATLEAIDAAGPALPPANLRPPTPFEQGLIEKYRKQGIQL